MPRRPAAILPALMAASFAYALTNAMINPILLDVARGFHVSVGVAGQARTILSCAGALTACVATYLAERIPRRRPLVAGHAGLSLARSFAAWMGLQAVAGVGTAVVSLAGTAAAADYFDDARRGVAMAWNTGGYPMAWVLGLPLVGWIADPLGLRMSYLVAGAGPAAVAFAGVLLFLPPPARSSMIGSPYLPGWRAFTASPAARTWVLGELLATTAWSGFLVFVGSFFGVTYGLRAGAIGAIMAVFAAASVLGTATSGWWGDRFGRRRVLLLATFLATLAVAPPLVARLSPLASLALVLPYGFLSSVRYPTSGTIALSLVPDAQGTMMAARALTITLGGMLGTVIGGIVVTLWGFGALGVAYALLTAAGLRGYLRAVPSEASAPARAAVSGARPSRGAGS